GVLVFDGPTRETCVVRRPRTNTPLQVLLLLNDETYVEAARALAATTLVAQGVNAAPDEHLRTMFRRVTARLPAAEEIAALQTLHDRLKARFAGDPEAAQRLVGVGLS